MNIVKETWDVNELIQKQLEINPRPQYQRTDVWTVDRKAFLIDSILNGFDIPKLYFKYYGVPDAKGYLFEIADGQQRFKAIIDFHNDRYKLKKGTIINGVDISNLTFSQLNDDFKSQFLSYELHISNITTSTSNEINELFTRLQKGVVLNPAEIRHAMLSNIGSYIDNFVEQQQTLFFSEDSKIQNNRFKHQEYIDHIISLIHYKNSKDLKASLMYQLYSDLADSPKEDFIIYFKNAKIVLDKMKAINAIKKGIFKNKWAFVDVFWFLYKNLKTISNIDNIQFASIFVDFEKERLKHNSKPEKVLKLKRHKYGKLLFDYIQAFNKEGANKANIEIRSNVFKQIFNTLIKNK